jgi:hypothetical protein
MDGYQDYFSQGGLSSADSTAADNDFVPFSQMVSYLQPSPNCSSPRVDMENLDLNSQANNFPFLDANSRYQQLDGGHDDDGTHLGRSGRTRFGEFLPPHPSGAGSRGGSSNSLNIGLGSDGLPLGMGAGGHGRLLVNRVGCGSTRAVSSSLPTEDADGWDHRRWQWLPVGKIHCLVMCFSKVLITYIIYYVLCFGNRIYMLCVLVTFHTAFISQLCLH